MGLDPSAWCGFCIGAVLHQSIKSGVAAGHSRAFLPNDGFTVAALASESGRQRLRIITPKIISGRFAASFSSNKVLAEINQSRSSWLRLIRRTIALMSSTSLGDHSCRAYAGRA